MSTAYCKVSFVFNFGGLHLFKQLAVGSWITWFILNWEKKWLLFSLKMTTFDHFEWKWLTVCEFTQVWQQLIFSQLEINQVIQEPTANCMNSCGPPSFCNQHFRFIKVSLFSNESIWDKFLWTCTVLYHKTYYILFYRIANALILKEVKEATNNLKKNVCTNFLFWQKIKKSNL